LFIIIIFSFSSCAKEDDLITKQSVIENYSLHNADLLLFYDSIGIYHNIIMASFYDIIDNEGFDTNQTFNGFLYNTLKRSFISNGITVEECFQEEIDNFIDYSQLYESIIQLDLSDSSELSMEPYFDNIRRIINVEMRDSLSSLEKFYLNKMFSAIESAYNHTDDLYVFYTNVEYELNIIKNSMLNETWNEDEHIAIITFVVLKRSFELVRNRFLAVPPGKQPEIFGLSDKQKHNLWVAAHITGDVIGGTIGAVIGAKAGTCVGPLGSLWGAIKGATKGALMGTGAVASIKACTDFRK